MSIIGECPHESCGETVWRLLPDRPMPCASKENCPRCGRPIWVIYSRVDPKVYTEVGFLAAFEVDEATKAVRPRDHNGQ